MLNINMRIGSLSQIPRSMSFLCGSLHAQGGFFSFPHQARAVSEILPRARESLRAFRARDSEAMGLRHMPDVAVTGLRAISLLCEKRADAEAAARGGFRSVRSGPVRCGLRVVRWGWIRWVFFLQVSDFGGLGFKGCERGMEQVCLGHGLPSGAFCSW